MTKTDKLELIFAYLDEVFPDAQCELIYDKPYEFAISVMLSAQATDKSVNKVTAILFAKYDTLEKLDSASVEDIEKIIRPVGLAHSKSKNIKGIVAKLLSNYDGILPSDKDELMAFPGIGNKSANVIRAEVFHIPEIAVDTHVSRVAKRLSLANENDDVLEVEKKLKRLVSTDRYIKTHHQFIHFGRYQCKSQNPQCKNCKLSAICRQNVKN